MYFKEDIDKVKERLFAFWEREIVDRACVAVWAPKKEGVNTSAFMNDTDCPDEQSLIRYWTDPETILKNNMRRLENTYLGGECLPAIFQNYGTDGHCNYFGAKPTYGKDTIWFDPVWKSLEDANTTYDESAVEKHLAIAQYLVDRAKDYYFVAMPDNCGTLDAICHLYGSENVLFSFIEEPDLLKNAIHKVNEGWRKTNEKFFKVSWENCGGGSAHMWMHLLAPGRLAHMQCDLSVMLSPTMYEEFILPELHEQMESLDYPVYHFDGVEQISHLPYLLSLEKLKAIQWTYVAGQPSAANYIPVLKRIQDAGKGLIIMAPSSDIPALMDGLSSKGLYIHTEARDETEAHEIEDYVKKHTKE